MTDASTASQRFVPGVDEDRAFAWAYAAALGGSLLASWLTVVYLGPGVREANPITAAVIATLGLEGMVAVRTGVLVAGYWGYAHVRAATSWTVLPVAFAWLGALVNLADAVSNLRVATILGPPGPSELVGSLGVLMLALIAGVLLRPPFETPDSGTGRR